MLLFSRPMSNKDISAFREMFQYSSLVKKPLDQCKIVTHWKINLFWRELLVSLVDLKKSFSFWLFDNANYPRPLDYQPNRIFPLDWSSERSETRQLGAVSELTMVVWPDRVVGHPCNCKSPFLTLIITSRIQRCRVRKMQPLSNWLTRSFLDFPL